MAKFLPYGRHALDADDIVAVTDVLENELLTTGTKVPELEEAISDYLGGPEVVVCSNGTTALHLAAIAAGLNADNCAIVPAITFLSTANAVRMTGADVIFADVDPKNGMITEHSLRDAIDRATKPIRAIMPVQLTGQSPDMNMMRKIADEIGAMVITDSCHAFGAYESLTNVKLGSGNHEDFACFSFHPVKAFAMGEGGAIVTHNRDAADKMRSLRNHSMQSLNDSDQPWAYEMREMGYNYRATDIQAALGLSQLKKIDRFLAKRRDLAEHYDVHLKDFAPLLRPVEQTGYALSAWHIYCVLIDFEKAGMDRGTFMGKLEANGIGSQVHYMPVCDQPYYRELYGEQNLPGARSYYNQTLTLPLFPALELNDVDRVVDAISLILS